MAVGRGRLSAVPALALPQPPPAPALPPPRRVLPRPPPPPPDGPPATPARAARSAPAGPDGCGGELGRAKYGQFRQAFRGNSATWNPAPKPPDRSRTRSHLRLLCPTLRRPGRLLRPISSLPFPGKRACTGGRQAARKGGACGVRGGAGRIFRAASWRELPLT